MNKNFIIPALTFVIGGCIGVIGGYKGTLFYANKYIHSDEFRNFMEEECDKFIDSLDRKRNGDQ